MKIIMLTAVLAAAIAAASASYAQSGKGTWGCYANNRPGGANGASWNGDTQSYAQKRALDMCQANRERGESACRIVECVQGIANEDQAMKKWR